MQAKLHRWAVAHPGGRFDDLFNLVHAPATLIAAFDRVTGNRGARTPGVDGVTAADIGTAHPLARHIGDFLTAQRNAGKSAHTVRAYRGDLIAFAAHHDDEIDELTAAPIRAYLSEIASLATSSRKRKRAAVASLCRWAVWHELLDANPMDRIETITVPKTLPRLADPAEVKKVFDVICSRRPRKDVPLDRLRDRVLFETAYICGTRASEACCLDVEDLDLRLDDEHIRVHGKGGTVLLDDCGCVALLKLYLARAGYTSGALFRPSINGGTSTGGHLSYDAAYHRWTGYCDAAGVDIDQLSHAHATELINAGVSIKAVRRRLGHASTETTQIHTLLADKVADEEIRAAHRRREHRR